MTNKQPQYFYTSDTHIGHRLVARERGFVFPDREPELDQRTGMYLPVPDTGAHDRALALHWDTTVRSQDFVFVLGDISISGSDYALEWHMNRPGTKILITGNHDPIWGFNRDSYKEFAKWAMVFEGGIFPFLRRKLGNHYFLMSHFPYMGTGSEGHGAEERHNQYRLPDMGMSLVHGHTHDVDQRAHVSDKGSHQLHVGLDAWDQKLLHQDTIQGWLENPIGTFYQ